MHSIKNLQRAGLAAIGMMAACPTVACAEEASGGIKLLLPAPAEFFPALISFIIIFVILSKTAWPMVLKMMEDRENKIAADIAEAADLRAAAAAEKGAAEAEVAKAKREAADIIAAAKRKAEKERSRILAVAQKDAAETIGRGKDVVEFERKRAMEELSKSVVDLSVEIAGRIIGNDLTDAEHRALAEKYLQEVGGSDAGQS
ncbi:MAG TPA: F0F1 ATP synthase subunit B [Atopobiaceae bacterium]|nr:F0F1 ATP synthase subunit B [Atopobiaceae bacterium]